jgi:hypothetical protein
MFGWRMAKEMIEKALPANACLITVSDVGLLESVFQGPFFIENILSLQLYIGLSCTTVESAYLSNTVPHHCCCHFSRKLSQYSRAVTLPVTSAVSWIPSRIALVP